MAKIKFESVEISADEVARIVRMGIDVTYKLKRTTLDRKAKIQLDSVIDEAIDLLLPALEASVRLLAADKGFILK